MAESEAALSLQEEGNKKTSTFSPQSFLKKTKSLTRWVLAENLVGVLAHQIDFCLGKDSKLRAIEVQDGVNIFRIHLDKGQGVTRTKVNIFG